MPDMMITPAPEVLRPTPELAPPTPESRPELPVPMTERPVENQSAQVSVPIQPAPIVTPPPTSLIEDQRRVENILAEGVEEIYRGLDAATQLKVKVSGEQASVRIVSLLQESRVQVKKILDLIISWLVSIPGLNRPYAEQAAKIKADKLLADRPQQT